MRVAPRARRRRAGGAAAGAPSPRRRPRRPAASRQPVADPVAELIAVSNRHFETGQRELQDGHLETAKTEFNRALEVLLESPLRRPRPSRAIREHSTGWSSGSAPTRSRRSPRATASPSRVRAGHHRRRCWRSRRSSSRRRHAGDHAGGRRRPRGHRPRHRHPAECPGAVVRRAVHRPPEGLPGGRAEPRRAVPADDSGGLPGRRAAAGPRLRAAGRERVQAERPVARQGQGHLAVHARHRRSRTA